MLYIISSYFFLYLLLSFFLSPADWNLILLDPLPCYLSLSCPSPLTSPCYLLLVSLFPCRHSFPLCIFCSPTPCSLFPLSSRSFTPSSSISAVCLLSPPQWVTGLHLRLPQFLPRRITGAGPLPEPLNFRQRLSLMKGKCSSSLVSFPSSSSTSSSTVTVKVKSFYRGETEASKNLFFALTRRKVCVC